MAKFSLNETRKIIQIQFDKQVEVKYYLYMLANGWTYNFAGDKWEIDISEKSIINAEYICSNPKFEDKMLPTLKKTDNLGKRHAFRIEKHAGNYSCICSQNEIPCFFCDSCLSTTEIKCKKCNHYLFDSYKEYYSIQKNKNEIYDDYFLRLQQEFSDKIPHIEEIKSLEKLHIYIDKLCKNNTLKIQEKNDVFFICKDEEMIIDNKENDNRKVENIKSQMARIIVDYYKHIDEQKEKNKKKQMLEANRKKYIGLDSELRKIGYWVPADYVYPGDRKTTSSDSIGIIKMIYKKEK